MRILLSSAVAGLFAVAAGTAFAATCTQVYGLVNTTPDATCGIVPLSSGFPDGSDFLLASLPGQNPAAVCFTIQGTGTARFKGYSGLTAIGVMNQLGQQSATPFAYDGGARATLTGFTAQAVLTGTLGIGPKQKSGTLYTKDTGTITNDGKVGQILKIVGGSGGFANATGTVAVAGQEVGGFAIYTGDVCLPD